MAKIPIPWIHLLISDIIEDNNFISRTQLLYMVMLKTWTEVRLAHENS